MLMLTTTKERGKAAKITLLTRGVAKKDDLKQHKEAIADFDKAIELKPKDATATTTEDLLTEN